MTPFDVAKWTANEIYKAIFDFFLNPVVITIILFVGLVFLAIYMFRKPKIKKRKYTKSTKYNSNKEIRF